MAGRVKTLYLLRHAKSAHDDPANADFDRPLTARGRRDARRMAAYMNASGRVPDTVICSLARRAVETWEHMAPLLAHPLTPRFEFDLYLAPSDVMLAFIRRLPETAASALVIGHNPGIAEITAELATGGENDALEAMRKAFPTCALAALTFDVDRWSAIDARDGYLAAFLSAADLAG